MRRALLERLSALLATPDPPELAGRGHRLILEGEADRRKTRLRPLVRAWLEHRHLAVDPEPILKPTRVRRRRRPRPAPVVASPLPFLRKQGAAR